MKNFNANDWMSINVKSSHAAREHNHSHLVNSTVGWDEEKKKAERTHRIYRMPKQEEVSGSLCLRKEITQPIEEKERKKERKWIGAHIKTVQRYLCTHIFVEGKLG